MASAIRLLQADTARTSDTHLVPVAVPGLADVDLYLKDESTLPSGSLKHRLARSLFLFGLCNGQIGPATPVIEASSGSTAISEAYFARMLGLRFIAVVPLSTATEKLRQIEFMGGEVHTVEPLELYSSAERLAEDLGGHYLDQFANAERVTDWRGNNNIAESLCAQMIHERHPYPSWIVVGAGTGGTSATLGRYVRYHPELCDTRIAVVDPERSVFADYHRDRDVTVTSETASRIEGIGRQRVEPSFVPTVIDRVLRVPDAASIGAMQWLEQVMHRRFGASTGTNMWGVAVLASEMRARGDTGSIVSLICDPGDRYADTYYDEYWLSAQGLDPEPSLARMRTFETTGRLDPD